MQFGIYTFVDHTIEPLSGKLIPPEDRIKNLLEEIELADKLGLEVFGIGEHHRTEFLASSPAVLLGAAAARTKSIRLSSAVTVLSSDDPVRVYQDFATIDLLSKGRAEIMAGRGSFIESFPLFGYDLKDYDELFSEKLELLLEINRNSKVNWKGKHRPSIDGLNIFPRAVQKEIPVWLAVGGTPNSAIRAGKLGLPMALAIIGGSAEPFAPFVELYRESARRSGNENKIQVGINSHLYLSEDPMQAADEYYPSYAQVMSKIGQERGWSAMNRYHFDSMREGNGALMVGSPEQVAEKILYEYTLFRHDRFLAQISVGTLPHEKVMHTIELFATKVIPEVNRRLQTMK
jgi:probable LLM family oxidoreductase